MRNRMVEVRYKNKLYRLEFVGCTVMPQCYSAVAENLKEFKGIMLLVNIGNGTMNLMYLNNGRPMESKSWTEKLGVFQCYQKIHNLIQDNTGDCLMAEVVESFLRTGETDLPEKYAKLMKQGAAEYTELIMQKLRDHEFNEEMLGLIYGMDIRLKGKTISYALPYDLNKGGKTKAVRGSRLGKRFTVEGIEQYLQEKERMRLEYQRTERLKNRNLQLKIILIGKNSRPKINLCIRHSMNLWKEKTFQRTMNLCSMAEHFRIFTGNGRGFQKKRKKLRLSMRRFR